MGSKVLWVFWAQAGPVQPCILHILNYPYHRSYFTAVRTNAQIRIYRLEHCAQSLLYKTPFPLYGPVVIVDR